MVNHINNMPDILLERFLLKELDEKELERVQNYIKTEAGRIHLETLKQSNQEILRQYTPEKITESINSIIEKSTEATKDVKIYRILLSKILTLIKTPQQRLAFAGTFAVIIGFFVLSPYFFNDLDTPGFNRIKGLKHHILVYKKSNKSVEKLSNNSFVEQNDVLQLSYVSAGYKYGLIFSVDGRGSVTLHFPKNPETSGLLKTDGEVPLKNAFELDDAPGFEKFYFLVSNTSINNKDIINQITEVASKSINDIEVHLKSYKNLEFQIFTLRKRGLL